MIVREVNAEIPKDLYDLHDEPKCHECGEDAKILIESDCDSQESYDLQLCPLCALGLFKMVENAEYIKKHTDD